MNIVIDKVDKLNGEIKVSGSKNACLPIIYSCLLIKGKTTLSNVPNIKDVEETVKIIKGLGLVCEFKNNNLKIINKKVKNKNNKLIKKLRASSYLLGCFYSLFKKYKLFYPGGCNLGSRPLNYHFEVLRKFGCEIEEEKNSVKVRKKQKLKVINISFQQKTFGGTINALLCSVIGNKSVVINNASLEPEIMDFINFLNQASANINVIENTIYIKGVKKLNPIKYKIMFDRIEAGSYLFLAAANQGSKIKVKNIMIDCLNSVIEVLKKMGQELIIEKDEITIISKETKGVNLIIKEYPSFPTDLQQILCASLVEAENSIIKDLIYPQRIAHIKEFKKANVNIEVLDQTIFIKRSKLTNTTLKGIDLRGNFSLIVLSGLLYGETIIYNVDNILRGYEEIIKKLNSINFPIKVLSDRQK